VGLADNIEIEEGTKVGAQAGVTRNIGAGQQVFGSPAVDSKEAAESIVLMRRLPKLVEGFKQLSKRVEKLEAADDDKD
jgi:UDP-3-O-[3-hydroxymyristoyl] glucosamine N-acyltransferase